MAKITVSEYDFLADDASGNVLPILDRPDTVQAANAAPSGSSTATAAFGTDAKIVRICSDVALHISFTSPCTVANDYYPAGFEIVRRVGGGQILYYLAG